MHVSDGSLVEPSSGADLGLTEVVDASLMAVWDEEGVRETGVVFDRVLLCVETLESVEGFIEHGGADGIRLDVLCLLVEGLLADRRLLGTAGALLLDGVFREPAVIPLIHLFVALHATTTVVVSLSDPQQN